MTKIRALRQARGLRIIDLSRKALVNPSDLSSVEMRRRAASRKMQAAISEFFGIPQSEAFDDGGWAVLSQDVGGEIAHSADHEGKHRRRGNITKIRALRQARGLSIAELSYEVRLESTLISAIERGRFSASRRFQEALSAFFGIPREEIFDDGGRALIYDPEPVEAV